MSVTQMTFHCKNRKITIRNTLASWRDSWLLGLQKLQVSEGGRGVGTAGCDDVVWIGPVLGRSFILGISAVPSREFWWWAGWECFLWPGVRVLVSTFPWMSLSRVFHIFWSSSHREVSELLFQTLKNERELQSQAFTRSCFKNWNQISDPPWATSV